MSLLRLPAIGALVIAIITTAAWLSAPWWLARIAEHQLNERGFHEVVISIDDVGLQQTHISRLHVKQQKGALEVDARNIALSYNIRDLLQLQLDSLTLKKLKISIHPTQQTAAEAGITLASPALVFSQIPARAINIDQITLHRLDNNKQVLQKLTGQASYSEQTIKLTMGESANRQGLQAKLSLDAQGRCSAHIGKGSLQILNAECQLEQQDSLMSIQGQMHTDLAALDEVLIDWIEMPEHRLSGTLQTTWTATFPINSDQLKQALTFKTYFSLDAKLANNNQPFTVSLNGSVAYKDNKGAWAITDKSWLRFGSRLHSQLLPSGLKGTFSNTEVSSFSLAKSGNVQLQNYHSKDMTIPNLNISLTEPLQLTISDTSGLLLSQPARITVHTDKIRWQEKELQSQAINIKLKVGKLLPPSGSIIINGFQLKNKTIASSPPLTMAAAFDLTHSPLTASGKLKSEDEILDLGWALRYQAEKQAGHIDFTLSPLNLAAAKPMLAQVYGSTYDIQSGTLAGNGRLHWSAKKPVSSNFTLDIDNMNGVYQNTTFSGLNADLDIKADQHAMLFTSKELHAQLIDTGLPLEGVSMDLSLNYPFRGNIITQISELNAETLGGRVSSEVINIDTGKKSNPFLVRLENIDSRQLAEFRRQEGLTAEGRLDGTLPFDWTDKGLKMTSGKLNARAPGGFIRYLGTASMQQMVKTDRATRMAMQILSDFRFRLLHISADYQPDGELALQLELKGNNPDYENGRPVEFNFNIEENVLKLLQSLRMADEISESLEKKVQKKIKQE